MDDKTPVSVTLICLNVIVFLIVEFTGGSEDLEHMIACGAAYVPLIQQEHEYYRLFTCMFLHFGMEHLVDNMLALYFVGGHLERAVGKGRFLVLYLAGAWEPAVCPITGMSRWRPCRCRRELRGLFSP